jgi:hypothetical protein
MLIKAVAPESKRKLKAPKIFSSDDGDIIRRFIVQQSRVISFREDQSLITVTNFTADSVLIYNR